jgi:hypothetical protein
MKTFRAVIAVGLVAVMSIGVSAIATGASSVKVTATSELLQTKNLSFGWTVHKIRSDYGVGCLKPLASRKLAFTSRASRTFVDDGNPPELTEILALSNGPAALYRSVAASLSKCHVVKSYFARHRLKGTVRALSLRRYGAASRAYIAKATVEGALLSEDVVIIETAHGMIAVAEGNVGSVSLGQFEDFIGDALRRIETVRTASK